MKRIALLFLLLTATPAFAQVPVPEGPRGAARGAGRGRAGSNAFVEDANAGQTQQRLQELLQQYPPSLRTVLALDPTLLTNTAYLEPYPQLAAFISEHPDIAHNPTYYFAPELEYLNRRNGGDWSDARHQAISATEDVLGGLAAMIVGLTMIFTIVWVIRTVIEHRKWLRVSQTHVQTHAKLMDRLTTNDELMAYIQSPAGRRFLDAAPIPAATAPRTLSAPLGRIFWSVQAGLVVAALGVGLMYASRHLGGEFSEFGQTPLFVLGITALAVGIGFFVSALMAYGMSSRLGLFDRNGHGSESGPGQMA